MLVIGGGPAGSAAAICCAGHGLRVALIERHALARLRPGESLHPGIEPLLEQLGVAEVLQHSIRFEGQWVLWNGPARFSSFGSDESGPWRGFQIARSQLDLALLQRARAAGVEVRQPCRAQHVISDGHRVVGVITDQGRFHASYLIDASGAPGWLSRQLRLKINQYSAPMVARYGYLRGRIEPDLTNPRLIADSTGWTWIAQVQEHLVHWTHLAFDHGDLEKHDCQLLARAMQTLTPQGPVRGADATWRISSAPADAGYFMVGDAASSLDPASSHGVLKALMSGMQAAQAVSDSLRQPALQTAARAQYSQWLSQWFEQDRHQLSHFYRQHPCPPRWLPVV